MSDTGRFDLFPSENQISPDLPVVATRNEMQRSLLSLLQIFIIRHSEINGDEKSPFCSLGDRKQVTWGFWIQLCMPGSGMKVNIKMGKDGNTRVRCCSPEDACGSANGSPSRSPRGVRNNSNTDEG